MQSALMSFLDGFKKFLLKGNLLMVAVAFVMASAVLVVVQALVADIITPLIGAIFGGNGLNFRALTFTLHGSVFHYGDLINAAISLVLVALAVYLFIVKPYEMYQATKDATVKKCPECISEIPAEATRCAYCTAALDS